MDKNNKSKAAEKEEEILEFWRENKIFEKSLKRNEGKKEFVFYDGPPFATGLPHYGHILPGTVKDVIPRFQTMRGKFVRREWGWDCHGLPIENIVEKELGLKSKKDILDYGIEAFNEKARSKILLYADDWKRIIPRTGRWVDMEKSYKTMDTGYTESVWWAFKKLYEKGLIYDDFKSMHICPRCETTLSNFEVNQGYKDLTDISVYVKCQITNAKSPRLEERLPKVYFLVWTTIPWTLPGNVALAINENVKYVKIRMKSDGDVIILAKDRIDHVVKDQEFEIIEEFNGSKLIGSEYVPVFDQYHNDPALENRNNGWKVYGADFVTTEEGTGIVHIAPAFGSDDYDLLKKNKLPFVQHVNFHGEFKQELEMFAGMSVKPKPTKEDPNAHQSADISIIKYLAGRQALFSKEKIIHSYPHCWRCESPLINYATSSWFLGVTAIKDKLVRQNAKVNWIPSHVKDGRFGKWLYGAKDWAISRSRFWGAPLPVWKCDKCARIDVMGSLDDIKSAVPRKNTYNVMRHGEAESNVLKVMSSDPGLHSLTEKGVEQVKASASRLKKENIDLIICSPFKRTKMTARIIREILALPVGALVIEPGLHEISAGVFDGKPVSEYTKFAYHEDRFKTPLPGGESQQMVKSRVGHFLYTLEKKYSNKRILIITHDSPAWMLFAAAEGATPERTYEMHDNKNFFMDNAEVRRLNFIPLPHNNRYETDLHRPYIDRLRLACPCGGEKQRIPEIFDTWFDSGSMPFAQFHFPFGDSSERFKPGLGLFGKEKGFPADFIAEGIDQTRGWFYTLLVISTALFGKSPYKNVAVNGLILAEDGRKMSKNLKNYPDPMSIIDKYGADALRLYMLASPLVYGEEVNFSEKTVDEIYKKNILRLNNMVVFYEMYGGGKKRVPRIGRKQNILDIWATARLKETAVSVTSALEKYELAKAVEPIAEFIDDASTWYLRRSRDRFKSEDQNEKTAALESLGALLTDFSKIIVPLAPFIAEDLYRRSGGRKESVHLLDWPDVQYLNDSDKLILEKMRKVREYVSLGLEARAAAGIKVRQPLAVLKIKGSNEKELTEDVILLIKDEGNVKQTVFDAGLENAVWLDTDITPELEEEGYVTEVVRAVQEWRKKDKFNVNELAAMSVETDEKGRLFIDNNLDKISKGAGLKKIAYVDAGENELMLGPMRFKINLLR